MGTISLKSNLKIVNFIEGVVHYILQSHPPILAIFGNAGICYCTDKDMQIL